eukprot:g3565.t1
MPRVFLGVKASDDVAHKVKRILLLCVVIAVVVVLQGVVIAYLRAKTGNARVASDSAMVKIMYGLGLPLIGYLGARLRSNTLLGCFAGCNVCGIVFFGITTYILIGGIRHIDEWIQQCQDNQDHGVVQSMPCSELHARYVELVCANFIFGTILFILNVLGCTWGF